VAPLGEYTALTAAGALRFDDAVPLVRFRAQAMQEAVPIGTGGMAVVMGLEADAVRALCVEASSVTAEVVEAVNFNDQTQIVIAGTKAAVEKACAMAKDKGAKRALPLPVSAPFHSSLLKPAADRLRERLSTIDIASPQPPVLHNVDVLAHADAAAIRIALAQQAAAPVRWVETVRKLADEGVTHVVEIGPGKVLQGLVKRIASEVQALAVTDEASLKATLEACQ
jgi:[acyl-carrier-protein] S-malonyltransferase